VSQDLIKAERAAFIQAVKALYIPLSLFLACVISAAGIFLVREGQSLGWVFITVAATVIISAFIALIKFQNNYRAQGIIGRDEALGVPEIVVDDEEQFASSEEKAPTGVS
jgi:hypothetical protein